MFMNTDFFLHDCKFMDFRRAAITVTNNNVGGMGVISNSYFEDNHYATVVNGSKSSWPDITPGTAGFLFVEDNHYKTNEHSIVGGEGALYVFRYNLLEEAGGSHAVDMHGARPEHFTDYTYSTRFTEIYENTIYGGSNWDGSGWEITCRGGEALIWGNDLKGTVSIQLKIDATWHGDNYVNNAPPGWEVPDYPIPYQIGYESGDQYGESHTGTDPSTTGAGDVFIWNNTSENPYLKYDNSEGYVDVFSPFEVRGEYYDYIQKDRDWHLSARPGYTPYTYPHPRRGTTTTTTTSSTTTTTTTTSSTTTTTGVDLRLHLKLDEASGTTAYDSSTYFNDGTLTGGFDFSSNTVPGAVDGALDFDGIDDNIDCGNDSSLQFGGAITVTAWVKTSSTANYMAIADLEDFSVDGFRFFLSDGQCRSYVMNNGANSWQFGPANLRDGEWHFVCFYSDASTRGGCVDGTFYTTSAVA
jgi:hypothetical protein